MADEQFAESGALLAIISGNEDRALELVKDMLTGERLALVTAAERLAFIADPANTCPACGELVDNAGDRHTMTDVEDRRVPLRNWHWKCWFARQKEKS